MHRLSIAALAFALLLTAAPARAEEAPPPAVPPAAAPAAPPAPKWYDTFEIHGLVDAYWAGNPAVAQSTTNALRGFDAANGFELSYAKLTAQLSPDPAGFRIDLGYGRTASVLNGGTPSSTSISAVVVQQAYASLKLPADIVLDAGRFVTAAGAEVIEAKDNLLYSRSILFYNAIPYAHLGARFTLPIKPVEGLSVMAGLVNGWDNPPAVVGSTKAGLLSVLYSGPSATTLALNVIFGDVNSSATDPRLLIDVVLGRAFGDLTLSLNGDFGTQKVSDQQLSYYGAALAGRYALLGDALRIAARVEYFGDPDGLSLGVADASYYEATLGLGIPVGKNGELRIEARADGCGGEKEFFNGKNSQFVGQVAALAWF
jgi:hypothetical protein